MEKSLARAKFVASRRDKRRFSHARRSHEGPTSSSPSTVAADSTDWDALEDLVVLEDTGEGDKEQPKSRSQGLDYEELLAQDPLFSTHSAWSRSLDPLEDGFADMYFSEEAERTSAASLLALDLDKLAESLSRVSLEKRLFVEEGDPIATELKDTEMEQSQNEERDSVSEKESNRDEGQEHSPEAGAEETVDVSQWLNEVLQDPEDGTSGNFEGKIDEEVHETTTEEELDKLLNMLDTITVDNNKKEALVEEHVALEVEAGEQGDGIMSQQDLDVLFWAPGSPKPSTSSPKPGAQAVVPGPEDDFDAWLDAL